MKKHIPLTILSVMVLFSLAASLVLAKENQPDDTQVVASWSARSRWFTQYIHRQVSPTILDVGSYNSIAINPHDNLPYVSYYNATDHDLMLASPVLSGDSNCGSYQGVWWCRAVDGDGLEGRSTDDTGQYSSIAFWQDSGDENTWKLGISYYDATNYGLKYAVWNCVPNHCEWIYYTIDWGDSYYYVGMYTSLHFDSNGGPHIAYYGRNNLGADDLWYTTYVADGTGNCPGSHHWECQVVDSGNGVGKFASLDIRFDDTVYIAYYTEATGDLKYAYYGGIGNCGAGNAWICTTIDTNGNVGGYTSFLAPSYAGDIYRVAYYSLDYHLLKYAQSGMSGGSGNCGPSNSWQCNVVDDMSESLPVGISMKLDVDGYPIIAYQYAEHGNPNAYSELRIARPYLVYQDSDFGNCGFNPGFGFLYWRCTTLDYGDGYHDAGSFVSLAVKPNGLALISYSEDNSYYLTTHLKLAYQKYLSLYLPIVNK
jgi:hypothetical protein